ncbi:MAG: thiamine pyrophosphate-dependent dehydrogenase E1 component subunit alpha, partial [Bacteroidales bacterium]|nr:thiamine pyrophosphate-dependent dehydrogenase E1 component subunit alpha [Bacteroidales bacterium]
MESKRINLPDKEILSDFYLAHLSRQVAHMGRKEVLSGKAKFGIFGDGKEIAQIAMAKYFRNGDWRSGYYRDHTFMMAAGMFTAEQFFYQLYGVTDEAINPGSAGRNFNNHFASISLNEDGSWKELSSMKNSCADLSPTAGQMPRLIGLGYASKLFRNSPSLDSYTNLSDKGSEVAFGMIGDASTAEGMFFETANAAAVLQIPVALAVWDDGYGISVTKDLQIVKASISEALDGFKRNKKSNGIEIFTAKGWDYQELITVFEEGIALCRKEHVPVLFHIDEMVQPFGHSTSGSHERYKSTERLEWERAHDPLIKMEEWILTRGIATEQKLTELKEQAVAEARRAKDKAWDDYITPIREERDGLLEIIDNRTCDCRNEEIDKLGILSRDLKRILHPTRRDVQSTAKRIMRNLCADCPVRSELQESMSQWIDDYRSKNYE